ncbi:Clo7bot family Cys-rich peptide [Paraclostridium bifermentans]|nr:Clo7bot family Cys-rich peptide [Paraclostridium bifermentans]TQO55949.1 Clo7bot family Cys-rich peptide [Paraclostridium bifermentans]GKZ02770.1 hypothetical protein ANS014_12040 [Paraclostridium bifermentans]GKZ06558.1 hypothetical protein ANS015_14410 [Paraclostridium bifermentans]GKZ10211.1 hypothetical protein ANS017_15950 [Paraclostridium bifermentans]
MKFIRKPAKKLEEGYCFLSCDIDCNNYCSFNCGVYSCNIFMY